MSEIDFSQVFGEQEASELPDGAASEGQGEKEQEVTAPAPTEDSLSAAAAKEPQSPEENAVFAAARRKAERERDLYAETARKEATAAIEAETAEILTAADFYNPYTGEPIRSLADLKKWQQRFSEEQHKNEAADESNTDSAKQHTLSPAEARAAETQRRAAAALAVAEEERVKLTAERELLKIQQVDNSVQQLSDVLSGEKGDEIYRMVQRGYTIADAYRLAYAEKLEQQKEANLRQALQNEVRSKNHLRSIDGRGTEQPVIPADIMREFRRLMPQATETQISRFYQKDLKNVKRKKGI